VNIYSGSTVVGRGDITIPATTPSVILYSRDPLRGTLLDTALPRSFNLLANEITLDAQPYFFSNESLRAGKISFSWLLNNTETSGPDTARGLLTLRQTGQGSGSAMVQVNIQNTEADKLIQGAQQSLQFSFGSSVGATLTSFFGL
jgi:hypothetical protein